MIETVDADAGPKIRFRDAASAALRFWEPKRVLYNLALFAVVAADFATSWPVSRSHLTRDTLLAFFLLAVVANVAYCAAYAVDLFVRYSGQWEGWKRWRWAVLAVGTAFAGVLAHFTTMGILGVELS